MIVARHRLACKSPKTGKARSLRQIADELAKLGHTGPTGAPYFPASIKGMLALPLPKPKAAA